MSERSIDVTVDISDFSKADILSEAAEIVDDLDTAQLNRYSTELENLHKAVRGITDKIRRAEIAGKRGSLINSMKFDHFLKIVDKYTLEEIETKLPE